MRIILPFFFRKKQNTKPNQNQHTENKICRKKLQKYKHL